MPTQILFPRLKLCLLAMAATALLSACGDDGQTQARPTPEVTAITITPQDLPYPMEYVGQTAGSREVQVRARVSGILQEKKYIEGSIVQKDELLFLIEPDTYQAVYDDAKAALAQAQAAFTQNKLSNSRILQLYSEEVVSKQERDNSVAAYDEAVAAVNMAKAKLEQAAINLGYTEVRAPITGITSKEVVTEGNLVSAADATGLLTTIVQLDPLYVNFSIPGNDYLQFQDFLTRGKLQAPADGYTVEIRLSNGQKYSTKGDLTFMDRQMDAPTAAVRARATLDNPKAEVLPGQFARVYVHGAVLTKAILIPQRAVLKTQQGDMVYVIDNENVANPRIVKIIMGMGDNYLLDSGLEEGERIMVEGLLKASPNEKVKVIEPEKDSSAQGAAASNSTAQ